MILIVLFLVLFFIASIPLFLIELLLGKMNPNARDQSSLAIVQWAFRVILFLSGTKTTIIGRENIPDNQSVLYIGNHRSFFDVIITYTQIKGLTGYISKKELEKVPFIHLWMTFLHCLFLDRDNIKEGLKTILAAIDSIKKGTSIFIFPEGTRSHEEGSFLPFHEGSFKIASKAGCPIIPVTINNSAAIWEDHLPWIKKAHVIVEFGAPIIISELDPTDQKHLADYTKKRIEETFQKNKEMV